jgi:hypothetical protein
VTTSTATRRYGIGLAAVPGIWPKLYLKRKTSNIFLENCVLRRTEGLELLTSHALLTAGVGGRYVAGALRTRDVFLLCLSGA